MIPTFIVNSDKLAHLYPNIEMHKKCYKHLDKLNTNDKVGAAYEFHAKN